MKEKKPADPVKKKKIRKVVLLIVIVAVIAVFAAVVVISSKKPMPVETITAQKGEIEQTINTSGTASADVTKTYFSDVNIKIGKVNAAAGDAVKAGDVLIEYDTADLNKETQLAELKLKSEEGSYQNSIEGNREKLGDISEASANLTVLDQQIADTEAHIKWLEDKIDAKKSDLALFGAKLQISLLDWQDQPDSDEYMNLQKMIQMNNYEQSHNEEIKQWEDELSLHKDMLSEYKEYRSEMKSQKSSAEAGKMTAGAKEELEANNETHEIESRDKLQELQNVSSGITAEFSGVVTEISAVEGASVPEGTQLLKLESTENVSVKISVTKYDLSKIALGQKAAVTVGGREYEGEVSKINKMAEKNNNGAAVVGAEIKILNPDDNLYLGVEAKVVISTARETDCIVVPVSVVNADVDGEFVYLIKDGILTRQPVVTGISSDLTIQILEGVAEGDQLVTDTSGILTEGMAVTAIPQS